MSVHLLVRVVLASGLALLLTGYFMSEHLPAPEALAAAVRDEPAQEATREAPFEAQVEGVRYRVTPRFGYDIAGLVVSLHDSDAWWDYAHREWNDHINVADLCVVWGENVRRDAYRHASYTHTQWECWWRTPALPPGQVFDGSALSNNHVVTDDPAIARRLREVRVGDEVRVRGWLIDYTILKDGAPQGTRKTSIVRTDEGEGACEVIWVKELTIVRSHDRAWRIAAKLGALLLLLGMIGWVMAPAKLDD